MNNPNARERILKAAVEIFAEKSFEGSRIEEISKKANVPKSLIYYHFKSKEEILEVLTDSFLEEYLKIITPTLNEKDEEKTQKLKGRMKNIYHEFAMQNKDLIRVVFIDSLKKSKEQPVLFKIVEAMIEKEVENNVDENYNIQERRIAEFFTSFIPNYAYVCFAEPWTKYFNIDRSQFDEVYLKVYGETHGAYHKNK